MHPTEQTTESALPPSVDAAQLARAVRFALVGLVVGLSYFSIMASMSIGLFNALFNDMLNGRPLPRVTEFILQTRGLFMASSMLVPGVAVGTLFSRKVVQSIYLLGALGFFTIGQSILIFQCLILPLTSMTMHMSSVQ
jgi:hypothetical protein